MHFIFNKTKRHLNTLYRKMDHSRGKTNDLVERTYQPSVPAKKGINPICLPAIEKGLEAETVGY